MRALQRAFTEQDAVVGDDADRIAPDMRKTANQGLAVQLLEFVELRTVDHTRDDVMHVERLTPVGGDHAVNLLGGKQWFARLAHIHVRPRRLLQSGYDAPRNPDRMA